MVQSSDEYPFWGKWIVNNVIASDITSVNYNVTVYNPSTNVFDSVSTGTISGSSSDGKWIVPFAIPIATGFKKYICILTPIGGSHSVLNDEINTLDGVINVSVGGSGTESHSGCVKTSGGVPIEGALVRAVPYGTNYTWATDTTDVNGEYTLSGLVDNHAYLIEFNKDGYWAKVSGIVIV